MTSDLSQMRYLWHRVVLYEASPYPVGPPGIAEFTLDTVVEAELDGMSTLYVQPREVEALAETL